MVFVLPRQHPDVQTESTFDSHRLEEVTRKVGGELTDIVVDAHVDHCVAAARQIEHGVSKGLIERACAVGHPHDALPVAQCFVDGPAKHDSRVFDGVV